MRMRAVLASLILLPLAALAEEPEGVYAKYHRAAIAGNLDEMLEQGLELQREDMKNLSAANRDAALMMTKAMMPRIFTLERKTVGQEGRATLIVSGPWDGGAGGRQQVYGTVQMLTEKGEWKVIGVSWTTERPSILAAPPPAAASTTPAVAEKSAPKAPMSTTGAPVVGSMAAETKGRKLGAAKAECVYKPVMTAQDMENCK